MANPPNDFDLALAYRDGKGEENTNLNPNHVRGIRRAIQLYLDSMDVEWGYKYEVDGEKRFQVVESEEYARRLGEEAGVSVTYRTVGHWEEVND